ncbi:MAG: hypothetical protein EOO71_35400 [Myxococcaceae bacterium]|nr:MAG: hypothetical protein EOO71_35400 [Myxococcaceae bacterium]
MSKHPWRMLLAAVVVLFALGGTWLLSSEHGRAPKPLAADAAAPPAPLRPAPPALATEQTGLKRSWVTGTQFVYDVSQTQQLVMDEGRKQGPPSIQSTLRGGLTLSVVGVHPDEMDSRFHLQVEDFSFLADGRDVLDATSRPAMLAMLEAPFYVTYNRQGAALRVHFEKEVGALAQNFLRLLVASTQFVAPDVRQDTWQAQELDVTGQYVARYRALPDMNGYLKQKLRYLKLSTVDGLRPMDASVKMELAASARYVLGAEGWPQSIEANEQTRMESSAGVPPVKGSATLRVERRSVRSVPALIGSLELRRQQLVTSSLATQVFAPQDRQAELKQLVGNARLQDLIAALGQRPASGSSEGPEAARLMTRLQALFTLDPGTASEVPALLRDTKEPRTASTLLGALSGASTPEAVRALGAAATDSQLPLPVRVNAAAMLGLANTPTPEGTQTLRELTRSENPQLHDTSVLALGTVARNSREQDASQTDALLRELEAAARSAPTPEARALWIRSLANSADPRVLPFLQEMLRDPLVLIRQSAVEALRLIASPIAEQLLASTMVSDASPDVRRSALFATSFRPLLPLLPALGQVLRREAVESVRMEAVRLLGSNVRTLPAVQELLAWVGQNDASLDIRHTALSFLAPPSRADPTPP